MACYRDSFTFFFFYLTPNFRLGALIWRLISFRITDWTSDYCRSMNHTFHYLQHSLLWDIAMKKKTIEELLVQSKCLMKSSVFWDITRECIPLKVNRRFGGTCWATNQRGRRCQAEKRKTVHNHRCGNLKSCWHRADIHQSLFSLLAIGGHVILNVKWTAGKR
jgi:hypothetical protein